MKTTLTIILCLITVQLISGYAPLTEWKTVSNSNGILVSERWVEDNNHTFRERKGEMLLQCSAAEVVRLISDVSSTSKWMKGVSECSLIKRGSATEWYTYTLYSIPYPFDDRDLVSHFRVNNSGNRYTINIESAARMVPVKDGISRLVSYNATWEITDLGHSGTKVAFTAMSDTPPMFPRWIQDPILLKVFSGNLSNLKELLTVKA
jgi:hypothetical protein